MDEGGQPGNHSSAKRQGQVPRLGLSSPYHMPREDSTASQGKPGMQMVEGVGVFFKIPQGGP